MLVIAIAFSFKNTSESGLKVINAYVQPVKVVPGDSMQVYVEAISNCKGIEASADMGGIETIPLNCSEKEKKDFGFESALQRAETLPDTALYKTYTCTASWLVHDTEQKEYTAKITAKNSCGETATAAVYWWDPTTTSFVTPTDSDNTLIDINFRNYTYINITVTGNGTNALHTVIVNWNETNITIDNPDLILGMDFNNNTIDRSRYHLLATQSGGSNCSTLVTGYFNGGCSFDNTDNDEVNVNHSSMLDFGTGPFTISVWVKASNPTANVEGILSKDTWAGGNSYTGIILNVQTGPKWSFETRNVVGGSGPDTTVHSAANAASNSWTHLTAVRNGTSPTKLLLYVNGVLSNTTTEASATNVSNSINLSIGYLNPLNKGQYFEGTIDELRIWNRVVEPWEINVSYNAELGRFNGTTNYYANITSLGLGQYRYFAFANDTSAATSSTANRLLSVVLETIDPAIKLVGPTNIDNATIHYKRNYTLINLSYYELNNDTLILNWNGTNITIDSPELTLRLSLNNNTNDTSKYRFDVFNNGSNCSTAVAGYFGRACQFDGTDDALNTSRQAGNFIGDNLGTISAWIKPTGSSKTAANVFGLPGIVFDNGGGFMGIFVGTVTGTADGIWIYNWDGNEDRINITYTNDEWVNIVWRHNNSQLSAFRNGVLVKNITSGATGDLSNILTFGAGSGAANTNFEGFIDEVRIWNTTLDDKEILASYNAELGKYYANFTGLTYGNYSYYAWANDTNGNVNSTETRTLVVKNMTASFLPNTDANDTRLRSRNYTTINVTVATNTSSINSVILDWNGTNISVIDPSLVLFLDLDNNTNDGSMYGNTGTPTTNAQNPGSVVCDTTISGKYGTACRFDPGSDEWISVEDANSLSPPNITISLWFKWDGARGHGQGQGGLLGKAGEYELLFGRPTGTANNISFHVNNVLQVNYTTSNFDTGSFHSLIITHNSTNSTMYLDGTMVAKYSTTQNIAGTLNGLTIGRANLDLSTGHYWGGDIDYVKIWNRVLSRNEIDLNYRSEIKRYRTNTSKDNDTFYFANITKIPDGRYEYYIFANDTNIENASTDTRTLYIDLIPPTISFAGNTDANGIVITRNWTFINISFTELFNETFVISFNGTNTNTNYTGSQLTAGPGYFYRNFTDLNQTNYTFYAWINDSGGNTKNTGFRSIKVDWTAPTVALEGPLNNSIYSTNTISFQYNATDSNNLSCQLWINSTGTWELNQVKPYPSGVSDNFTSLLTLFDGDYLWNVQCNDSAGTYATNNTNFTLHIAAKPGVTFVTPTDANNSLVNRNYSFVNITLNNNITNFDTVIINWNGTNITIDDQTLLLALDLNNNTNDRSRYGNTGTRGNGVNCTTDVKGKFQTACEFDGTDDVVTVANSGTLNPPNYITVMAWVYPTNTQPANSGSIATKQSTGFLSGYSLRLGSTAKPSFVAIVDTVDLSTPAGTTVLQNNSWYNVIGIYNGSHTLIYVNGALEGVSTTSQAGTIDHTATALGIGRADVSGVTVANTKFIGRIDEIRIWNRSMSAAEINASYNAELGRFNGTTNYYANFTNLAEGNYTYFAFANDTNGNFNSTLNRLLHVDTSPPAIYSINASIDWNLMASASKFIIFNVNASDTNSDKCALRHNETGSLSNNMTASYTSNANTTIGPVNFSNDGVYNFTFYCNDTATNNVLFSRNYTFVIDTLAPKVALVSPTNNSLTLVQAELGSTSVSFTYNASDTNNQTCELWTNMTGAWVINKTQNFTSGIETSMPAVSLVLGTYLWNVQCNDTAGNYGTNLTNFTLRVVQSTPFNIDYVSPTDNDNKSINFRRNYTFVNVSIVDSLSMYNVIINWNGSNETLGANGTVWYSINETNLSEGNYTYFVWANDTSGNQNSTPRRTIVIDNTIPSIYSINASQVDWHLMSSASRSITYSINATDMYPDKCTVRHNATGSMSDNMSSSYIPNANTTIGPVNYSSDGKYNFTVYCNDTAGNGILYSKNYTITIDSSPPLVNLLGPSNNSRSYSRFVSFSYNATDAIGNNVSCELWTNMTGTWAVNKTQAFKAWLDDNFSIVTFSNGKYIWNVRCNDSAKNYGQNSTNFTLNVDSGSFSISYVSPTESDNISINKTHTFVNISLTGNVTDMNEVVINWNGTNYSLFINNITYDAEKSSSIVVNSSTVSNSFGWDLASGDFNGDGISDLVVGEHLASTGLGGSQAGQVHVFLGPLRGRTLNDSYANFTVNGSEKSSQLGYAVSSGDFNGDGISDLVIGANLADNAAGGIDAGRFFVFFGGSWWNNAGISFDANSSANFTINGSAASDAGIYKDIASGDLNSDGIDDLAVGAVYADPASGGTNAGKAYVFLGGGWLNGTGRSFNANSDANLTINGSSNSDQFGKSLEIGDFNADNISDLAVSADQAIVNGMTNTGKTYIFFGGGWMNGTRRSIDANLSSNVSLNGSASGDYFGGSISSGDFNGDGVSDLIVGANAADALGIGNSGKVYVFLGGAWLNGTSKTFDANASANVTINGSIDASSLGDDVDAGDFNNDGISDLLIGADGGSPTMAYILFGSNSQNGKGKTYDAKTHSNYSINATTGLGWSLTRGDFNGDRITDFALGEVGDNVYLFYGSGYIEKKDGSYYRNFTRLSDGNYTYFFWANDSVSNENSTALRHILIDTTTPVLSFVSPTDANDTLMRKTYSYVNATLTEVNLHTIFLNWNGTNHTLRANGTFTSGNFYSINMSGLSDGNYTYYVEANDTSGNTARITRQLLVDTALPTIYSINASPVNWNLMSAASRSITFSVNASDPNSDKCAVRHNASGSLVDNMTVAFVSNANTTVGPVNFSSDGVYNFTVYCNDTAGNNILHTRNYTLTVDTIPPGVSLVRPTNNTFMRANIIGFQYNVTEVIGNNLSCRLWTNMTGTWAINKTQPFAARLNENFSVTTFTNGTFLWNVECNDTAGNYGTNSTNYTLRIDTSIPIQGINFVYPTDPDYKGIDTRTRNYTFINLTIYGNVTPVNFTILNWNGTNNTLGQNGTSGTIGDITFWSLNVSGLMEGNYTYFGFFNDSTNLQNSTEYRVVVVDLQYPNISFVSLTDANNTFVSLRRNWTLVNVSYYEINLPVFAINFNGTNYTNVNVTKGINFFLKNFTDLSEGNYSYFGWINDSAGHENSTDTRLLVVDITPPQINFSGPTYSNETFIRVNWTIINATFRELYNDTIIIDFNYTNYSNSALSIQTINGNHRAFYRNISGLMDGNYSYYVWMNDSAGNINETQRRLLIVDTIPPIINNSVISSNNSRYLYVRSNTSSGATVFFNSLGSEGDGQNVTIAAWHAEVYNGNMTGNTTFSDTPRSNARTNPLIISYTIEANSTNASTIIAVEDRAGNNVTAIITWANDSIDPVTSDDSAQNSSNFWYSSVINITLTATEHDSGFNSTWFCIQTSGKADCTPNSIFKNETNIIQVNCSGNSACQWLINYYSMDNVSNNESGGTNGGRLKRTASIHMVLGSDVNYTLANNSNISGNSYARNSILVNSSVDACKVLNSNITSSTLSYIPTYRNNCTIDTSTIISSNITSSIVRNSFIDPSIIVDSVIDYSNITNGTVYYSRVENSTFCRPNIFAYEAVIRNDTLVSGLVKFNGTSYYGPFAMSNLCSGVRPFSAGTLTASPNIVNNTATITFTYIGGLGYNVSINKSEFQTKLYNSTINDLIIKDDGVLPDQLSGDATYNANFSLTTNNNITDGTRDIIAYIDDLLGNRWNLNVSITLDNTNPNASIAIQGLGATGLTNISTEYTTSRNVLLSIGYNDSVGVGSCRYSNEDLVFTPYETCSPTRSWLLTQGDGNKTVVLEIRDSAGNINRTNDTIYLNSTGAGLDQTPPITPTVIDDGTYTNTKHMLHSKWNSSDPENEILHISLEYEYRISWNMTNGSNGFLNGTSFTNLGKATEARIFGLEMTNNTNYTFELRAINSAGLRSSIGYSDGIITDLTQPSAPNITSSHTSNWTTNSTPNFNFISTDTISGISGYSYVIDANQSTIPDKSSESETDHQLWQGSANTGQTQIMKYNFSGNGTSVFIQVNQNLTTLDNIRVTVYATESHVETPDLIKFQVYATSSSPTGYNMTASNITTISEVTSDIKYKQDLTEAEGITTTIMSSTSLNGSFFIAIAGAAEDDDNNYNLIITGSNQTASINNATQSFLCAESGSCTNQTLTFDYGIKVEKADLKGDSIWDKSYSVGDGKFYFHARALDNAGNWGEITTYNISVDNSAPSTPQMTQPVKETNNNTISFEWTQSTDPESGVDNYYLEISNESDFSTAFYKSWTGNITNTTATIQPNISTKYYARVKSKNQAGVNSSLSSSVSTRLDVSPPVVTYIRPNGTVIGGATTIAVSTNETAICRYQIGAGTAVNFTFTNSTYHESGIGLTSGSSYTITVTCEDAVGNAGTATASVTAQAMPSSVTFTIPSSKTVTTGQASTITIHVTSSPAGGIPPQSFSMNIDGQGQDISITDEGSGNYSLAFLAPMDNGTKTMNVSVIGSSQTGTLIVQNLMFTVQFVDTLTPIGSKQYMTYAIQTGNFSIGIASQSRSVSVGSSATSGLNLTANAQDSDIFIFLTKPTSTVERLDDILKNKQFLDSYSPSFGYAVREDTFIVYSELQYDSIAISSNSTFSTGRQNLVIENKGFDPAINKTMLRVKVT